MTTPSRDDLAERYLAQLPYTPYPLQEDALLSWFTVDQGVMVCAPIFELIEGAMNPDREEPAHRTQIQVTDKPFEFYFTETQNEMVPRFVQWLDEVVSLAISQYQRNL